MIMMIIPAHWQSRAKDLKSAGVSPGLDANNAVLASFRSGRSRGRDLILASFLLSEVHKEGHVTTGHSVETL